MRDLLGESAEGARGYLHRAQIVVVWGRDLVAYIKDHCLRCAGALVVLIGTEGDLGGRAGGSGLSGWEGGYGGDEGDDGGGSEGLHGDGWGVGGCY
jgi:hypothetical protein